ncbi:hypothetical protein CROQUDRAFT_83465 [Cronartium quercuum f. sp. fusiforme G11]|uniref:Indoleamine 2,3-dioxygenase n=1 Tax=Cronartium quercuum f. sp. fusiforme G11 TaxID=708437 RepID=A0A9P6T6U4_9BASI|nr:hypothetical protein CROQUDRAFT_83465 [Cronartium quercuum f. sp. fusiforme G11]
MSVLLRRPLNHRLRALPIGFQSIHHRGLATHYSLTTTGIAHHPAGANAHGTVQLLEDIPNAHLPHTRQGLPAFTLSRARGFLPRDDPLIKLPPAFEALNSLLERMTLVQPDGSPGLLAKGTFGQAVIAELCTSAVFEEIIKSIEEAISNNDQLLLSALFRDYSFLTSAYLLEPVDLHYKQTGEYCTGRDILPAPIAVPFKKLADALGHFPYMEYASSYALQNFARINPNRQITYDNLRLIRGFQNRDKSSSESGFILVHVDMVAHSGRLITSIEQALGAVASGDRASFNDALDQMYQAYQAINASMHTMWGHSKPADYLKFRSFIFGTGPDKRLNKMFPNGVWYEGVSEEPLYFRGESGANDSMIPVGDNLLEITACLPKNEFTAILRDFRTYRPKTQRDYVESVEARATAYEVKKFAESDPTSLALYILNVDQIREFRDRHWKFTKSYILEHTTYGIATGGSPIATYLPSNLTTVLNVLGGAYKLLGNRTKIDLPDSYLQAIEECRAKVGPQIIALEREVAGIVARQTATETSPTQSKIKSLLDGYTGDEKPLQRGRVGCDGVG